MRTAPITSIVKHLNQLSSVSAVAIALTPPWNSPEPEKPLADLAREAGFAQVSASHEASPSIRLVPRGDTTVADAYLSPVLRRYVAQVAESLPGTPLYFMQAHGGPARADGFTGKDAILSGPAGGIVGAVRTAGWGGFDRIISFDMGGTSTDVALYDGAFERRYETEVAGVRLRAPMLAITTVAAGGDPLAILDAFWDRIGHVHLKVADLDRAVRFYRDTLGFTLTHRMPGAAFLSAGGYHHHVAVNTWAAGSPPASENDARLLHWEFVLPTPDHVSKAASSLRAAGFETSASASGTPVSADPWNIRVALVADTSATQPII